MPFYVDIQTQSCGSVTAHCGTQQIADRASNTDEQSGAGADRSLVNRFRFELVQAHDQTGNSSLAPFTHQLTLFLPDYEPLISAATNVINKHDLITKLVLNATRRINSDSESVTQSYTMTNGILTQFNHQVLDQRDGQNLQHRGEVILGFRFQHIQTDDKLTQTVGVLNSNSVQGAA